MKKLVKLQSTIVLGVCLAVIFCWWNALFAGNEGTKGVMREIHPSVLDKVGVEKHIIPINPRDLMPCKGPDPAVVHMQVDKNPAPTSTGHGRVHISAVVTNLGKSDFVSRANQQSIIVMARNPKISGPGGQKIIINKPFTRLAKGASINVSTNYNTWYAGFLQWGWRQRNYGECQVEEELVVSISYDPDIRMDSNEQNDDCNLKNNKRVYKLRYMVRCPW